MRGSDESTIPLMPVTSRSEGTGARFGCVCQVPTKARLPRPRLRFSPRMSSTPSMPHVNSSAEPSESGGGPATSLTQMTRVASSRSPKSRPPVSKARVERAIIAADVRADLGEGARREPDLVALDRLLEQHVGRKGERDLTRLGLLVDGGERRQERPPLALAARDLRAGPEQHRQCERASLGLRAAECRLAAAGLGLEDVGARLLRPELVGEGLVAGLVAARPSCAVGL